MGLFNVEEIKKMRNGGKPVDEQMEKLCIKACSEFFETADQLGLTEGPYGYRLLSGYSFSFSKGRAYIYTQPYYGKEGIDKAGKYLAHLCGYNQRIGEIVFERAFMGEPLSENKVKKMVQSGKYD